MTSLSQMWYGSLVRRHGRSLLFAWYQGRRLLLKSEMFSIVASSSTLIFLFWMGRLNMDTLTPTLMGGSIVGLAAMDPAIDPLSAGFITTVVGASLVP